MASPSPEEFELTPVSTLEGALYPVGAMPDRAEISPVMSGSVRIDDGHINVPLAAFLKMARNSGLSYLHLSIGFKGDSSFYGQLFAATKSRDADPDYIGFITLLPVSHPNQYTSQDLELAPSLRLHGYKRPNRSNAGERIQLIGVPVPAGANKLPI